MQKLTKTILLILGLGAVMTSIAAPVCEDSGGNPERGQILVFPAGVTVTPSTNFSYDANPYMPSHGNAAIAPYKSQAINNGVCFNQAQPSDPNFTGVLTSYGSATLSKNGKSCTIQFNAFVDADPAGPVPALAASSCATAGIVGKPVVTCGPMALSCVAKYPAAN